MANTHPVGIGASADDGTGDPLRTAFNKYNAHAHPIADITGGVPSTRLITTQFSLAGGDDLSADLTLNLAGDMASPGNNKVYGTDGTGARLWKNDPSGTLPSLPGNALRLLRVNAGATGVEWAPLVTFLNTSGTQASQPSGGKWKMTGAITNVPVTNGWEGLYINFSGGDLTLAPASGTCRVIETGASANPVTVPNNKGVVAMADGTNLIVMGDVSP